MSSPAPDKHAALALYRAQRLPEAQAAFEAWCALHPGDAEACQREAIASLCSSRALFPDT
jgi:hypothetical protein